MPTLIINEPGRAEPLAHRCSEEQITIGRLDDNTIQLLSEGVSRRHAKIICEGENFFLVDMESGNGTYLNGIQIKPNEKNLLQAGDLINIDDCSLSFQTDTEA
ncbi:MAG: FHA domain-containing protein, partial [Deltaproteobacteria bacterium]|nr:FHA domain-containing protein [Deltaproteobacteria bacterium]